MEIYKNRYQANKVRSTSPWYNAFDMIIKVDGGYVIMAPDEYRVWKLQK